MYAFGKISGNESILNSAKSVDVGRTIYSDNHGIMSVIMQIAYSWTNILPSIYDLIKEYT